MSTKQSICTSFAPSAIGPYSQGIESDRYAFLSGQLPIDPGTGEMPELVTEQARVSLSHMRAV